MGKLYHALCVAGASTLLLVVLPASRSAALQQTCPAPPVGNAPLEAVRYLADDRLEGRLAGSAGERCAGDYIAQRFRKAGLEPAGDAGTYFQSVALASTLNPHLAGGTGRNVVGLLRRPGVSPDTGVIVIGAHYDHLGTGAAGSLEPGSNAVHNGADDNASGVAGMLRAMELLAADPPSTAVLFIAFTGEEAGLLGSAHFVNASPMPTGSMRAMLNLDMVGRLGAGPLIVYGVGTAAEWAGLLEGISRERSVPLALQPDGFGPSDHTSFYARDVPVLHFFTNTHADYHKPSDDWEKIDEAGLEKVAAVIADVTRTLATQEAPLTLQRGAGARPAGGATAGGYGAYLGSVPDFTPVARGVLLGGVTPGSPADRAGLRKGDIIVRLGEHDVNDLQGLTDALRAHRPGDEVRVHVLREERELTLDVVLGSRSAR